MKRITFSADDAPVDVARQLARMQQTTLSAQARLWFVAYASGKKSLDDLTRSIAGVARVGRRLSRDKMNER